MARKRQAHDTIRKRRCELLAAWPYCHWCACELVEFSRPDAHNMPDNAATLDHLFNAMHPGRDWYGGTAVVLACRKCNHRRGVSDNRRIRFGIYVEPVDPPEWWDLLLKLTEAR